MHYYKLNIPDWVLHTNHLNLVEEAIYFRLVNHYYDTEQPIPKETHSVFRRLRMANESDIAINILDEFFVLTDKGYEHKRCEELIKEFKKTANKNKKNGAKGGRPRKITPVEKPSGLIVGSQDKPKHNLNQELLTINQELLTNIKKNTKPATLDFSVLGFNEDQIKDLKRIRKANKGTKLTQRIINALSKEFHQASAKGFTFDELLTEWECRGWKSFKSEWIKQNLSKVNNQFSDVSLQNIENFKRVELK